MRLVVLGLNHKTAPVDIRECFSFSKEQIKPALKKLKSYKEINECVILSTCNRMEIYAVVDNISLMEVLKVLKDFLEEIAPGAVVRTDDDAFFYYKDEECVEHLFRVSASLDSLIIGEGQILSQVKTAYNTAKLVGTTSTVLNTLFNKAIAVGKRIRTATKIAFNAVSISYAAVELAKKVVGDISNSNVFIIGAGEMGELTVKHLIASGAKEVFVANRHFDRAKELADKMNGKAVAFENSAKVIGNSDIVITSTGAPHYIISASNIAPIIKKRKRPIIFIDIAVPRDVEPEVGDIEGATLYNIDNLEKVIESNLKAREEEAMVAEDIIKQEMIDLFDKFQYLAHRPTLLMLTDKAEQIRETELRRALSKLPDLNDREKQVFEHMSKMIVRKMLRDPVLKLNEEVAGKEQETYYQDAIRKLFKLDKPLELSERKNRVKIGEGEKIERPKKKSGYRYAQQ
ncbi:glutamyl-tRNA reductase [Selenomonadales bacterium OttesenSCG-928-I06]|nr:glutamyl-tRNA reductase [Selenomonadales bacterium OttesenSCG-928-I06]